MQRGLIFSVLLHTLVVLGLAIGLPFVSQPKAQRVVEVSVDVARIADITNPPKGVQKAPADKPKKPQQAEKPPKPEVKPDPVKKPEPKPKPKPAPVAKTKPEPKPDPPKQPDPPKKPEPEKKQQAALIQPEPKKVETPKPKKVEPPKPRVTARPSLRPKREVQTAKRVVPDKKETKKPEPKKKAAAPDNDKPKTKDDKPEPKKAEPKPKKKAVKRVAAKPSLRPRRRVQQAKKPPKPKRRGRLADINKFLNSKDRKAAPARRQRYQQAERRSSRGSRNNRSSLPLSISERAAIARQIRPCWRFPVGAKNERTLRVEIKVWMGRDGRPERHKILDRGRYTSDSFYRAAADAGIRAIYNPACLPIRLPAHKYNTWRVMILDFDPAKVSGGSL